jgi:hypothetical protein
VLVVIDTTQLGFTDDPMVAEDFVAARGRPIQRGVAGAFSLAEALDSSLALVRASRIAPFDHAGVAVDARRHAFRLIPLRGLALQGGRVRCSSFRPLSSSRSSGDSPCVDL